jgi:biotin carboxyl carrier protein
VAQQKDGAIQIPDSGDTEPQFCLVTLLRNEGEVVAVSAVVTRCRDLERAQQRLQSMLLIAGYFDLFTLRRTSEQARAVAQSHQHVLQLATSVATAEGFQSAAMGLCNELANRANASRVSLGWVKHSMSGDHDRVRVKALSHTEEFDKKQELIVELERVMEECLDQEDVVQFEPDGTCTQNVTREAQALSRSQGGNSVLSIPLRRKDEIIGILTMEFAPGQHLGPQAATGLAVAADLLAPQLYDRFQNDRWLITKTAISAREGVKMVVGKKYWVPKLIVIAAIIAFLYIMNLVPFVDLRKPYRVSAHFAFAPIERRYIHAPFDGHIEKVLVQPGDPVVAGKTVLFMLNTDELREQLNEQRKKALEAEKQAQKALHDPHATIADSEIYKTQKAEAEARAAYYQYRIDRASVKAEIDGVVLEGDLRDKVGAPVKLGDQLMIIGKPDSLKGELKVAERDVQDIKPGAHGTLATSSLPAFAGPFIVSSERSYPFVVDRVVPGKTEAKEGENYFQVFVTLQKANPDWLPGMEGEARVEVTKKPIAWIWTHRFVEWASLKLWSSPITSPFTK